MKNSTKEKIKQILTDWELTRDCDYRLYAKYFEIYHPDFYYLGSLKDWLLSQIRGGKDFDGNYIPCLSVIKRRRAELQNKYPELRGIKYNKRQEDLQNKALESLGYEAKTPLDAPGMTP